MRINKLLLLFIMLAALMIGCSNKPKKARTLSNPASGTTSLQETSSPAEEKPEFTDEPAVSDEDTGVPADEPMEQTDDSETADDDYSE
ncbi:hypothetical protein ACFL5V_06940 [Fibrobacterota bacterium]